MKVWWTAAAGPENIPRLVLPDTPPGRACPLLPAGGLPSKGAAHKPAVLRSPGLGGPTLPVRLRGSLSSPPEPFFRRRLRPVSYSHCAEAWTFSFGSEPFFPHEVTRGNQEEPSSRELCADVHVPYLSVALGGIAGRMAMVCVTL